jgi:hypothetical protein
MHLLGRIGAVYSITENEGRAVVALVRRDPRAAIEAIQTLVAEHVVGYGGPIRSLTALLGFAMQEAGLR